MATAKKLKSGNYRVNLYVGIGADGKRKYKSFTAETKKAAEYMAAEYNLQRKRSVSSMSLGEAIDKYIESKENILSATTISGYKTYRRNCFQQIMHIPVNKLTQVDLQNEINRESKRIKPKSVCNVYGLISATLSMYAPDLHFRVTLPKKTKKIKNLPSPNTIFNLFKGTEIELPVLLGMWLGLRMSEIRGVRYEDINDGVLIIQNTIVTVDREDIEKNATKTLDSTRRIRLPNYILDLIEQTEHSDTHIIQLSGSAIYKRFKRVLQKNNIEDCTFHDLRHINASVMLALGIADKYAMERGGWSSPNILKSVYQHTFSDEREKVDDVIDTFFNNIINDAT